MDNGRKNFFSIIKQNWLFILIAAQPVLDVLAYWTNNTHSSWAGYIRLGIMIALPVCMLFSLRRRRHFVISMLVIGLFCVLHVLNCFRVGYIDPFRDISYMARVAQMPVLAICFVYAIKDERMKDQAVKAMETAAGLVLLALAAAIVTGTENVTYGVGLGVNRTAELVPFASRNFQLFPAATSQVRAVFPTSGCAVVAGGNDGIVFDDDRTETAAQAGSPFCHGLCNVQIIVDFTDPFHNPVFPRFLLNRRVSLKIQRVSGGCCRRGGEFSEVPKNEN